MDRGEAVLTFDLDKLRVASLVSMRPDPGPCRFGAENTPCSACRLPGSDMALAMGGEALVLAEPRARPAVFGAGRATLGLMLPGRNRSRAWDRTDAARSQSRRIPRPFPAGLPLV